MSCSLLLWKRRKGRRKRDGKRSQEREKRVTAGLSEKSRRRFAEKNGNIRHDFSDGRCVCVCGEGGICFFLSGTPWRTSFRFAGKISSLRNLTSRSQKLRGSCRGVWLLCRIKTKHVNKKNTIKILQKSTLAARGSGVGGTGNPTGQAWRRGCSGKTSPCREAVYERQVSYYPQSTPEHWIPKENQFRLSTIEYKDINCYRTEKLRNSLTWMAEKKTRESSF